MISAIAVEKPSVAWPAAKIEIWPIERLTTNPRNACIHGPEQIEQIRASLREFGWTMPVLVRENGMLIAGHGRLEAAKLEGITEVPTIVARGWSEAQCRAYAIADNKLTEASEWNEELLRLELGDLRIAGFDLALTGFDQDEFDRLLVVDRDVDGDPDDAPEPPVEPISRPGDLWICGEHRVLCGDARVLADVEKVLGGQLADMCFTDSPYNVNYSNSTKDKKKGKGRPILNDALGEEFGAFLYDACVNILTVTKGAGGPRRHQDTTRPFEISKELRTMAERSLEQAKLAFSNYTQASEEAVSTFEQWVEVNRANAQNIRKKAMNFAQRNVLSAFEFTQKMVQAKDIEELIQAQTEFVQSQVQDLGEQVKQLGEAATVSVMERVKELSESVTKAAIKNVKHLGATASKTAVALEKVGEAAEAA